MNPRKFTLSQNLIGMLASVLVRLIKITLNFQQKGLTDAEGLHWTEREPCIVVFWHNQQLFMPWSYRIKGDPKKYKDVYAVVSQHSDGRLAASFLEYLNVKTIAGSSSKGGRRAFTEMFRRNRAGCHIAITPDGPKGPPEEAKFGAVKLASMTGAKIKPLALNAEKKWTFSKSWDKIFIPKPFSKTLLMMGDPIEVKPKISKEELEEKTQELTAKIKELNLELNNQLENM